MEKEKGQDLVASIVRVCDDVGTPRGTGFLASAEGLIVTCAHVVEAAGIALGGRVVVRFARADEPCQAEILAKAWRPAAGDDVAVLRLDGVPPSDAKPVMLGESEGSQAHPFRTFGYPPVGKVEGLWAHGQISGIVKAADRRLLQLNSSEVTPGMSGAPVLDEETRRVVGMISEIAMPDPYGRLRDTAFATRAEAIVAAHEDLVLTPSVSWVHPGEERTLTEDELPFSLEKIPRAESFVGRAEEIAAYRSQLEEENLAVVEGMGGVGKTALGAELAWQFQEAGWKVFWLTLIRGVTDHVEEFIARLAGFLAVIGEDDRLWRMLQAESADGQRFNLGRKFEVFLKSAEEGQYVLCLDDFHIVAEAEGFRILFQLLRSRFGEQREDYPMKLIIMGRQVADYMVYLRAKYDELPGLSFEDAKAFLDRHHIRLDGDLLENLHKQTEGNTQMLDLSIGRLQDIQGDTEKVERFIANLPHQNQIQALMEDISRSLSSDGQLILSALSLFRSAAVGRPELEAVLVDEEEVEGLHDGLRNLIRWHVARQTEDGQVSLHDLVKEYAYDKLDATPRRRMHARAGRYFEGEKDYIEAAYHYYKAGQFDDAATALADRTQLLINQGHREVLLAQLEKLRERRNDLTPANWIAVVEGLGDVYRARSDYEAALQQFEESIRLQEKEDDPSGLARAYNKLGDVYLLQGDFPKVAQACQIALDKARVAEDVTEEARAHLLLGVAYYQEDAERAATAHQKSLAMAKALGDASLTARSHMFLALDYRGMGKYKEAAESNRSSLELFLEMGDAFNAASAYNNLGIVYSLQYLFDEALDYYRKGLALAVENGDAYLMAVVKGNMGEAYYGLGDYLQAEGYLEEAIAIARDIGQVYYLAGFTAHLGEVKLALGDPESALELGMRSLELARETGNKPQEGVAHQVMGEVYAQMGDLAQAEAHLRAAVEILEVVDSPVEEAKAKQSYGRFLLRVGEQEKGAAYLQQALTMFGAIEATREGSEVGASLE